MRKYIFTILFSAATISGAALADDGTAGLSTYIANEQTQGSLKHFFKQHWFRQNDQGLLKTTAAAQIATNTATATIDGKAVPVSQATAMLAAQKTTDNLDNSLTQFFYNMYENSSDITNKLFAKGSHETTDGKKNDVLFKQYLSDNNTQSLTVGKNAAASDTLYVSPDDTSAISSPAYIEASSVDKPYLEKPKSIDNNALNFASLITPTAYNSDQENSAKQFLKYSAQSTTNFADSVNLSLLYPSDQLNVAALAYLKNDSIYQQYQFQLRSLLAVRSMLLNSMNQLIAERTPQTGLANAAGIPTLANAPADQRGQIEAEINNLPKFEQQESAENKASPLQVEAYQANHRVENPAWYANIENAPPATVQRETLIVLAEIEHQNYEAHLDRERLLAAITAVGLQNNTEQTHNMVTLEASKVQQEIKSAIDKTKERSPVKKK